MLLILAGSKQNKLLAIVITTLKTLKVFRIHSTLCSLFHPNVYKIPMLLSLSIAEINNRLNNQYAWSVVFKLQNRNRVYLYQLV